MEICEVQGQENTMPAILGLVICSGVSRK
jgi:hypothetical protein